MIRNKNRQFPTTGTINYAGTTNLLPSLGHFQKCGRYWKWVYVDVAGIQYRKGIRPHQSVETKDGTQPSSSSSARSAIGTAAPFVAELYIV